jgi:colanic acid/amylovoran biosynthesis protein
VITGRMHLAIMALWNRTPAIALATQGKVEGLMALFDSAEFCVEPTAGFGARILPVIDSLITGTSTVRERLADRLPAVTSRARRNFEGISA